MSEPPRAPTTAIAVAVVVAVGGLALALAASHVKPSGYVSGPITRHYHLDTGTGPTRAFGSLQPVRSSGDSASIGYGLALIAAAFGLAIVAGVVLLVVAAVRSHRWGRREVRVPAEATPPPDVTVHVAEAVESGLDELADDSRPVRDRIIACWLALQAASERAGIARAASDTPTEAVARVLAHGNVSLAPLHTLATLYREARFSTHVMSAADVASAREAFETIRIELWTGVGGVR